MGNSITYDSNSGDNTNPRPAGDRISYRYRLYQLISQAGYNFDYVGSENAGNNYFQNADLDDNAGFPGIEKGQLVTLLSTGVNPITGLHVSPGAYLLSYPADIILLHIGTNNLTSSASEVSSILDVIRSYDTHVIVLVARIINRMSYSALTNTYNNNVEAMVTARNDPKIIMVNMETGAGINYSTDMYDDLHPNTTGYNKMAAKWFDAINNINSAPQLTAIPQQTTLQGTPFGTVALDNYVTDLEDSDANIHWTYELQANSKLSVTVDASRILHVAVSDNSWYGSETLTLKATDSGNGAFTKFATESVVFTVTKKNSPPVFTSSPITSINEDQNYSYTVSAQDVDGDALTFTAPVKPSWLSFSDVTHSLSGRPTNENVGVYDVSLQVSDGKDVTVQSYKLTVINVNDLPVITSTPVTTGRVNESYLYEIHVTDPDVSDVITYAAIAKPAWLTLSTSDTEAILFGIPGLTDVGANAVILSVSDGHSNVIQGFTISVAGLSPVNDVGKDGEYFLYPNPARGNLVYLKCDPEKQVRLEVFNINGILCRDIQSVHSENVAVDLNGIPSGVYYYKVIVGENVFMGSFTKFE